MLVCLILDYKVVFCNLVESLVFGYQRKLAHAININFVKFFMTVLLLL